MLHCLYFDGALYSLGSVIALCLNEIYEILSRTGYARDASTWLEESSLQNNTQKVLPSTGARLGYRYISASSVLPR